MKIDIDRLQQLYLTATNKTLPARDIFKAEYELMQMMPEVLAYLIEVDKLLRTDTVKMVADVDSIKVIKCGPDDV